MPRWNLTALERLMARVEVQPNGCWWWTGPLGWGGYGTFYMDSKWFRVHRASYILHKGEIPPGLEIDHTCHKKGECPGGVTCPHRKCVNPDHLEPVTKIENIRRGNGNEAKKTKTHCVHGHEFTTENTKTNSGGKGRACRECCNISSRRIRSNNRIPRVKNRYTHCPHGHEFTPENTYYPPSGTKGCRECRRISSRLRMRARRAAAKLASHPVS